VWARLETLREQSAGWIGVEAASQALRLLRAHRVRSLLTTFGIVWGTASVIFLGGWGEGVAQMVEHGLFKTGRDLGEIFAGQIGEDFTPAADRRNLWFTLDDLEALRRRARLPTLIAGEAWKVLPVAFRRRSINADVRGIEPDVAVLRGVELAAGREITRNDLDGRRRVAILGERARRRLLGAEGGVGSHIRLDGQPFTVIGLLAKVGTQLHRDRMEIDDQIWVPLSTLQLHWPSKWTDQVVISRILFRYPSRELLEETNSEVRAILAQRLGTSPTDDEAIRALSSAKALNRLPLGEIKGFMVLLAVSLLAIGGVNLLNMMLESVHERRQEIGIRLALGARRRDVIAQFFLETFIVTIAGGAAGLILGIAGCALLGRLDVPDVIPVPIVHFDIVALALFVLTSVGIAAGVVPAWRASRIDPAYSLRME
jgi:putative ABC transport system permease protein